MNREALTNYCAESRCTFLYSRTKKIYYPYSPFIPSGLFVTLQKKSMKKLLSVNYSDFAFNLSIFLLRAASGLMLFLYHGLPKLENFNARKDSFSDPLHIGHTNSLLLAVFAEVFCALLVVAGLFSRLASLVLVIFFIVIIFVVSKNQPLEEREKPLLFLLAFFTILLCGPGKWSIDKLIGK